MSKFMLSLLLFLAINLLAAKAVVNLGQYDHGQKNEPEEQTWTEWALADFEKEKGKTAPVVILGSSLVLTPVNLADAKFFNHTVNGAIHHKSDMLNNLLVAQGKDKATNFNFAIPGLMPSDAFLITKLLLPRAERGRLIIYGIGPRDFLDNLLASPASTDPYHSLSKLLPKEDKRMRESFVGTEWQSKLDYLIGRYIPFYGEKEKILEAMGDKCQLCASQLVALVKHDNAAINSFTVADVHNLLPNYEPMSIGIKQAIFFPNPQIDPNRFAKDLNEYRSRYGKANWDTFTCQTKFFVDFLKLARNNDDKVLIIAMPITSTNRQLLPEHVFSAYKNNLRVLSKTYGATFVDLDNSGRFNDEDFGDTVHLSTTGSIKLIEAIANYIEQYNLLDLSNKESNQLANVGVKL